MFIKLTYESRAVRALVLLHDEHLRRFLVVWKQARAASVTLPQTEDPAYVSLDTLLRHVLRAARGYMTWMCEVLELPDPEILVTPDPAALVTGSRRLHGACPGAMAGALARRRRRSTGDARVSLSLADAILHRRDAGTRGHASDPARVSARRIDGKALIRRRFLEAYTDASSASPRGVLPPFRPFATSIADSSAVSWAS